MDILNFLLYFYKDPFRINNMPPFLEVVIDFINLHLFRFVDKRLCNSS